MPKKFSGENTKAVAARERKKAQKEEAQHQKEKQLEDAKWKDDSKQAARKQQKKEAEERKKQEQLQRKAENKALLEKEMSSISKPTKTVSSKTTRSQIESMKDASAKKKEIEKNIDTHLTAPLIENLNRLGVDEEQASNIDEAIHILSTSAENVDKHPEKRLKAAYTAYEERRLKILKAENPSLRMSQLKQMVFKEWQKSSENPLNKT